MTHSRALCNLLTDENGHLQEAIQAVVDSENTIQRHTAAIDVLQSTFVMCPNDRWKDIVVNGVTLSSIAPLRQGLAHIRREYPHKTLQDNRRRYVLQQKWT